jgi:hypothetical protein
MMPIRDGEAPVVRELRVGWPVVQERGVPLLGWKKIPGGNILAYTKVQHPIIMELLLPHKVQHPIIMESLLPHKVQHPIIMELLLPQVRDASVMTHATTCSGKSEAATGGTFDAHAVWEGQALLMHCASATVRK